METSPKRNLPPYVLALFDDTAVADDASAAVEDKPAPAKPAAEDKTAVRDQRGRFSIPATDDPRELKRALEDAQRLIESAHDRVSEVNREAQKHRQNFQSAKSELEAVKTQIKDLPTLQQQVQAQNQRLLRSETRDALRAEGVVHDRIVDLFLADHKDKVSIDQSTGEPVGIKENLAAWKEANAAFFKPKEDAKPADDAKAKDDAKDAKDAKDAAKDDAVKDDKKKDNATAGGASPAGGASSGNGTVDGLPDLRKLNPEERKKAVADYKRTVRLGRGR